MEFLAFLSCALAIASASYYDAPHISLIDYGIVPGIPALHTNAGYHGLARIADDGTPIDTPEVQLAKAAHFNAYKEAAVLNSVGPYAAVITAPLDIPEVQLAKTAHLIAHAKTRARAGHHYLVRRSIPYAYPYQAPAPGHGALPVDTPEVQAAKAQHLAAVAQATSYHNSVGPHDNYNHDDSHDYAGAHHVSGHYDNHGYTGAYHAPVIGPNGVPAETPEVQAAKAQHLAALAQASTHHNSLGSAEKYNYDNNHQERYSGPYHIPVIGPNGVPQETPEVQAAKAAHLASYGKLGVPHSPAPAAYHVPPATYSGHYTNSVPYGGGAPVDTPEVQAAKAAHLAAHSAAGGHHHHY